MRFGPYVIPVRAATSHFLFMGASDSGKTTLIDMLFTSALKSGSPRTLLYDAKGTQKSWAYAVGLGGRFKNLDPFDARGLAWDIAADALDPMAARQIATILIPTPRSESGNSQFFTEGSREILTASMLLLNELAPLRWTFRDLLLLALDSEHLQRRLSYSGSFTIGRSVNTYLKEVDKRLTSNLLASLSVAAGIYEPVAGAWSHADERYSMARWGRSHDILVLGNKATARATIDPINRAIPTRAAETVLDFEDLDHQSRDDLSKLTFFFLDEIREAGKIEALRPLLNQGRSKGASVVLGVQDVEGLRSEYEPSQAEEMLGQCAHKAVLRLSSPQTAEWSVRLFGERDEEIRSKGETFGSQYSENQGGKNERRSFVTTADLLQMPSTSPENGLTGYYKSPAIEQSEALKEYPHFMKTAPWKYAPKGEYSWDKAVAPYLNGARRMSEFSRPASQFILLPWTDDERLKLFGKRDFEEPGTFKPIR